MWSRSSGEIRWSTSTASSPRPICTQLRHRGCACSVTSQETPGRISLSTRQLKLRHPPEGAPGCARTTATDQQPHRRIAGVGAPQWRWSRRRPSIVSMETISVQESRFRRPAAMLGSATRASLDSATRCALGRHASGSAPPVRLAASRAEDGQVQAWAPTTVAQATATELDFVSLPDAPSCDGTPRYCGEVPDVGFEEAHAVLACLAGLAAGRPRPAAAALGDLVLGAGLSGRARCLCAGRREGRCRHSFTGTPRDRNPPSSNGEVCSRLWRPTWTRPRKRTFVSR
jgi:hypothetical protein